MKTNNKQKKSAHRRATQSIKNEGFEFSETKTPGFARQNVVSYFFGKLKEIPSSPKKYVKKN